MADNRSLVDARVAQIAKEIAATETEGLLALFRQKYGEANVRLKHAFEALAEERRINTRLERDLADRPTKKDLEEAQARLQSATEEVARLVAQLSDKDTLIGEQNAAIAEKDATIAGLEGRLSRHPSMPDQLEGLIRQAMAPVYEEARRQVNDLKLEEAA
jgi:chromosome segregation ATPase